MCQPAALCPVGYSERGCEGAVAGYSVRVSQTPTGSFHEKIGECRDEGNILHGFIKYNKATVEKIPLNSEGVRWEL